jgi:hypothetical protein
MRVLCVFCVCIVNLFFYLPGLHIFFAMVCQFQLLFSCISIICTHCIVMNVYIPLCVNFFFFVCIMYLCTYRENIII